MKELADIIALARTGQFGHATLATVVRTDGSSYRRPGASLLIGPDGRRLGSVSGGCLERDVEQHARAVLASGEPRLITYDTRGDDDAIFGTQLGCGGLIEIFLERVDLQDPAGPVFRWSTCADLRQPTLELLIVAAPAGSPLPIGSRTWLPLSASIGSVDSDSDSDSDSNADLIAALIAEGGASLAARESTPVAHTAPYGEVRAFLRVLEPPVRLLLCGAGDDGQPVARTAINLGWRVWVMDHRAAFATPERFPGADRVLVTPAGTLPSDFLVDARTVAVIMNHHYPADSAWLNLLAPLPLPYIGLLGARHRTARLLRDGNLPAPGPGGLEHLYAPAGLDIGAEGPEAIALSIIAEAQAVLANRPGGRLRDVPPRPAAE
jgi:xanthine/CO dehydrogenase XdhC/CoxF family maturation factor